MRTRTFLVRAGMALVLIAAGLLLAAPWRTASADDDDGGDPRVRRGFEITPVPPDLKGKDRELVGLGSYLVNAVAGCNDCHTNPPYAPGHNPFMGQPKEFNAATYLAGGTKFGSFVSKNLTPDNGKPAGLTREEFVHAMRTGESPHVNGLLQVMPWPVFQSMTHRDLHAIYEYLRAIPAACAPAPNPCRP